jgi:tetratricopeptide (TPR) repeat protein
MILMRSVILVLLSISLGFAQTKKSGGDLCVPPPSGVAPALPAKILTGQGEVHFPITAANPEAQRFFDQGVAQMYSFWAREAERSFLQAAALDPEAPMPQWGIAMVAAGDFRPRFQIDVLNEVIGKLVPGPDSRAIKAAKRAQELAAVPGKATDLEKMYIAAAVGRRLSPLHEADDAYVNGLRAIVAKYPREIEAKAYLALHVMRGFVLPDRSPRPGSMEAANLLRELLRDAPEHPGVHHFVIHGFEGSLFAADAWPSCKRYAELVTNIPHALHMPGHIYSQTGKLKEAQQSFNDAAVNERSYMAADSVYGSGHHGHNVNYLSNVYSMDGQFEKAMDAARELLGFKENPRESSQADNFSTAYRQGWFSTMRALVQAEKWDLILDGRTLPVFDKPRQRAWRAWAAGIAHASTGHPDLAKQDASAMSAAMDELKAATKLKMPEELIAAQMELAGHIEIGSGKVKRGLKTLEATAKKERALVYTEPPYYPRPVSEALGIAALKHGQNKMAAAAFRAELKQFPGSARALSGLRQALPAEAGQ